MTKDCQDFFMHKVVNVTSQVIETVKEIALPNPHHGLWFLIGFIVALILYMIFSKGGKK